MTNFLDQIKADAYVAFSYEITDTSGILTQAPTTPVVSAAVDFGEDPWPFNSLSITAQTNSGLGQDAKTLLTFENVGHILPMEWTVERKQYDAGLNLVSTDTLTCTLITSVTFTCECTLPDGTAQFTATFKSPV